MKIRIQWTDGDTLNTTLESFLKDNSDDEKMAKQVNDKSKKAKIGKEFFKDGGGAMPEFSLIRLT